MENKVPVTICWLRRDLRLHDHAALYHALRSGHPVLLLFVFDQNILSKLSNPSDPRVTFIYRTLKEMRVQLRKLGSDLLIRYGDPVEVWKQLLSEYQVAQLCFNHDYERYARSRDEAVKDYLLRRGVRVRSFKDQVIFEKDEILKADGTPYTVFTPYSKKWREKSNAFYASSYPTEKYFSAFLKTDGLPEVDLQTMGFQVSELEIPPATIQPEVLEKYHENRDFPGVSGTSKLGIHLRFGTISIRKLLADAMHSNQVFVNELIWRDFYQMILWHFPHVEQAPFRKEYARIAWRNDARDFDAWCKGKTGYPLVDAGMRELNATGYMHNRVRMVVASFLSKHLLIDWKWGEAYFAAHLLDFDLASNNGGWQWAAGCGTDAAPYFRVFSPSAQAVKFDPQGTYIKKWIPEIGTLNYPAPIVDHDFARKRALAVYKAALQP